MNIYKSMGLECLLEKNAWDSLNDYISENTRYVVPGYKYNYRLCSFPGYVEFHRCELADGTPVKTDMHFSANHHWELEVQNLIEEDVSTSFYALKTKSGNSVPVRIVCPDVLPSIECGVMLSGQVVAFADSIVRLPDDASTDGRVADAGENCATISGVITDVNYGYFKYNGIECRFHELDVETENGAISVLIAEDRIDYNPEIGDIVSAHALISMDLAIDRRSDEEKSYYTGPYEGVIEDADEVLYRNGFLLGFHNNQKVLTNGIVNGDFSRIPRCCAETIDFAEEDGISLQVSKHTFIEKLKYFLPENVTKAEIKHILSCKTSQHVGHDGIVVSSENGEELVIWFDIDEIGFISSVELISPDKCSMGIDNEFHLQAMFAHATCNHKWYILHEYLTKGCMYRSEYSDTCLVGAPHIASKIADVEKRLNEANAYTYEHALAEDELIAKDGLPLIYQSKHCTVGYQGGKTAYVVFLMINEENKIKNILLSCNPNYLKRFESEKNSSVQSNGETKNVSDILSSVYGKNNTVESMRRSEIPDVDTDRVYIWKKADEFAGSWLKDNGYKVYDTVLTDDCIGYACERKGTPYAVFVYACGEEITIALDGGYCSKLRNEAIAQGKEIIVIYLQVTKKENDGRTTEYTVGSYAGDDCKIEPWLLTTVMGRDILRFYPQKEMMDLIPRLISAYNTKNLDALKVICTEDVFLETYEHEGRSLNDGFYSHLSRIREGHGKMKLAYIRFNDVVFCAVPYIENYAYISFTAKDKIDSVKMNPLNETYRELLILDGDADYCPENVVPALSCAEFLEPSGVARFSIRLTFENGEIRRYNLAGNFNNDEIVQYQRKIMTDKIFANGRIADSLPMPEWMGYQNYAERGQGIEFMSGATLSVEELYHGSYPTEKFSYAGMDNVHIMQADYSDDGFAVGYIPYLDPQGPCYLLDKNTMTATVIPDEYQDTPIGLSPFYGGYSEGLVMVSKLGELELQFHHNYHPCAGLWGWLDKNLNTVIEPKYIFAKNFVNGRAIVCKGDWDIEIDEDGEKEYWCDNEQWGVIDRNENEIVPCRFDEIYEIGNTDKLYFVHEGGWENGHCAVFDTEMQEIILELDFDFDIGYMFNYCFVANGDLLVFDEHLPGEEKDLIYIYDLVNRRFLKHGDKVEGRTFNGKSKCIIQKDGIDIIIF